MNLDVKKLEKNYLEVAIMGEDISLADSLREIIIEDKDVEFAAAKLDHIQLGNPILIVRTKSKDVLDVVLKAIGELKGKAEDFKSALKAAKKPK